MLDYQFLNHASLVTNCTFVGNEAVLDGGAVWYLVRQEVYQTVGLQNCVFDGNRAAYYGGAVFSSDGDRSLAIRLRECRFTRNYCPPGNNGGSAVGGIEYNGGAYRLENCLVVGNLGAPALVGGGWRTVGEFDAGEPLLDLRHCTVAGNEGGGVRVENVKAWFSDAAPIAAPIQIRNSIVVGNGTYGVMYNRIKPSGQDAVLLYNDVYGHSADYLGDAYGMAGTGSISADPLFVSPAAENFMIGAGSPCIDAGAASLGIVTSLNQTTRPIGAGYDMGCYEVGNLPAIDVHIPIVDATSVVARAVFTYESPDDDTYAFFVVDTEDRGTTNVNDWAFVLSAGPQGQDQAFSVLGTGLTPDTRYVFRCVGSVGGAAFFSEAHAFTTPVSGGATCVWTGLGGDSLASTAANWSESRRPSASDYILLHDIAGDLIWDAGVNGLPASVRRWTQTETFAGAVSFRTTYPEYDPAFTNFFIAGEAMLGGGLWTHPANSFGNTSAYRLRVSIDGAFLLDEGAAVNVDGRGFQAGFGPGAGAGQSGQAPSHGGQGGFNQKRSPAHVYGSAYAPVSLGSGAATGGAGGGAAWLTVGGEATINGALTALSGPQVNSYTGSGGSVYLVAKTVCGSGSLGAWAHDAGWGHGAGGGRIAVKLTSGTDFGSLALSARGGNGRTPFDSDRRALHGAAGTVYLQTSAQSPQGGVLIIDNAGVSTDNVASPLEMHAVTLPAESMNLSALGALVITPGSLFAVTDETTLDFATAVIGGGGELKLRSVAHVTFPPAFSLPTQYRLALDVPVQAAGAWSMPSGAVLTHSPNTYGGTEPAYAIDLTLNGSLAVATGAVIHVAGRGYASNDFNDFTFGPTGTELNNNRAPSHGGQGGATNGVASATLTYGEIRQPSTPGSGSYSENDSHGTGGGTVKLDVSGALDLQGSILAMGNAPSSAGGSVFLTAGSLSGGGVVDASGAGHFRGGGGGGGRIAVRLTSGTSLDAVVLKATGGAGFGWVGGESSGIALNGAAGTMYVETPADAAGGGTVFVANGGQPSEVMTPLPPFASSGEDILGTRWQVGQSGRIGLLSDMKVESVTFDAGSVLDLNGHTLYVNACVIDGQKVPGAAYAAGDLGATLVDGAGGGGVLVVKNQAAVTILR